MEDDRFHPLSDAPYLLPRSSQLPPASSTPSIPLAFSRQALSPPRPRDNVRQHNRRLQARNARFPGSSLPSRRMSPFLTPTVISEPFTFGAPINDECPARTAERGVLHGEEPQPGSILRQITNSSYRQRQSPRTAITTVFQDASASKDTEESQTRSRYQENSNEFSPSLYTGPPLRNMKLREGSLNERTAPAAGTSVGRRDKGRRRVLAQPRTTSDDAAVHMAVLEAEIAKLNSCLAAFTSPNRTRAHAAKVRTLQTQVRKQTEVIAEWELKFQERAEDAKYGHAQIEQRLQTRIRALEGDCELKEVKVKELEWELETVRAKVKTVESLELTNQDLDRRVEVLTGLLGQSPTRLDFPSVTLAPGSRDPTKRTPRPTSLRLPRLYTSPASVRHSASLADAISWHSRHTGSMSSLSISETPEDELRSPFDRNNSPSILSEPSSRPPSMLSAPDHAVPPDPATRLSSRPTLTTSHGSFGASWGVPAPNGSSERSQSAGRGRKMRRFPSGQCSLKPLILPVAAAVGPSLPVSAPATTSHATPSGDVSRFSRHSIDPTTAFLSRSMDDGFPFSTPTQRPRRRSASLARRQTLEALEGRSRHAEYEDDGTDGSAERPAADNAENNADNVSCTPSPCVLRTQRRSLQIELEQAEEAEKAFLERGPTATSTSGILDPDTMTKTFGPAPSANDTDAPFPPQNLRDDNLRLRRMVSDSSDTPRPLQPSRPPIPSPAPSLPAPSAIIIPSTIPLLSRLTGLLSATNPAPLILAKRILANASQTSFTSSTGGLGWWLLGLLLGFGHRKQNVSGADVRVVEEEATGPYRAGAFDWHAYSAEASKARRAQALWRDLRYRVAEATGGKVDGQGEGEADVGGRKLDGPGEAGGEAKTSAVGPPQADTEPANPFRCAECVEPPSRHQARLWMRFSLAVFLAVRVALTDGPGALLGDDPPDGPRALAPRSPDDGGRERRNVAREGAARIRDSQDTMVASPGGLGAGDRGLEIGKGDGDRGDSGAEDAEMGGWDVGFAEGVGPEDFAGMAARAAFLEWV